MAKGERKPAKSTVKKTKRTPTRKAGKKAKVAKRRKRKPTKKTATRAKAARRRKRKPEGLYRGGRSSVTIGYAGPHGPGRGDDDRGGYHGPHLE